MVKLVAHDYVVLPAGVYAVRLIDVEERISRDGAAFLLWHFEVVETEYAGASLTGVTSLRMGATARARQWAEALLGRRLTRGEEIDTDQLVGRRALATVTTIEREGREFNRVISLAPARKASHLASAEERLD